MHTTASDDKACAGGASAGPNKSQSSPTSTSGNSKVKRRKSLTRSIRARLSRQSSRESNPSLSTTAQPPVPFIPRSYSSPGSLDASPNMHPPSVVPALNSVSADPTAICEADLEAAWSTIVPPAFPIPLLYTACYCEENVYLLIQRLSAQLETVNRAAHNIARKYSVNKGASKRLVSTTTSACSTLFVPLWDLHAVFISNSSKTVLLYQQNASKLANAGSPVIWDYHVVAAATCHLVPLQELVLSEDGSIAMPACFQRQQLGWSRTWIYDSDSRLAATTTPPCVVPLAAYNQGTFHPEAIETGSIPLHLQPCFRVVSANDLVDFFASDRSHMLMPSPQGESGTSQVWSSPPPKWEVIVGPRARQLGISNNLMDQYVNMNVLNDQDHYGVIWDASTWFGQKSLRGTGGLGASLAHGSERKLVISTHDPGSVTQSGHPAINHARGMYAHQQPQSSHLTMPSSNPDVDKGIQDNSQKGGRIASPLFPAYLHASQQHRSHSAPSPPPPPATSSV